MWASEIEPYPIAVTRSRFPNMKHLGSVTDIKGDEIEPVDIITFGSPCQDLSVAGKRAGLKHEDNGDDETTRSGLFMEAIRIIKEMRKATNGEFPKYCCWENVPGAYSSNNGQDFRIVLEELIKIVEPSAVMPPVPKNGWPYADSYCGEGWSLAYRTFDAQYWGVPQRRRRIYLVLDLRAERAEKILFERDGLYGNPPSCRAPWQRTADQAADRTGADDREGENAGSVAYSFDNLASNSMKSSNPHSGCRQVDVAKTIDCFDPNPSKNQGGIAIVQPVAYGFDQGGQQINVRTDGKSSTLRAEMHGNVPAVMEAVGIDSYNLCETGSIGRTLSTPCGGLNEHIPCVYYPAVSEEKTFDARGNGDGATVSTITGDHENRITDYSSVVIEPICCIDGDKIGKAERSGGSGLGVRPGDKMYTITAKDAGSHGGEPAVAYSVGNGQLNQITMSEQANTLDCMHDQQCVLVCNDPNTFQNTGQGWWNESPVGATVRTPCGGDSTLANVVVAGVDCRNLNETPELYPTMQAKPNGGQSLNFSHAVRIRYIVRRLTPTECARLQGFADRWATPDYKDDFTDEEYRFWCNVYLTKLMIDGKVVHNENGELVHKTNKKPYKQKTKVQMLKWYNDLPSDSNEYKLWGNGIAFPNALYVMQGIADALNH